jgi:methionyl-tRNA formyltransferase
VNSPNPDWWRRPRRLHVVIDNPSWFLPFGKNFVESLRAGGDEAELYRSYDKLPEGEVAMFLGCIHIASAEVLQRHRYNLVVHESELPRGRGFSPLSWQIIEGEHEIAICLLEAAVEADAGPVYMRDVMHFDGHELIDEMRQVQAERTIALCRRFLGEDSPPRGLPQQGAASHYPRRRPVDSALDPQKTLMAQFNLLRTVDNERYPAYFDLHGHRYYLTIRKIVENEDEH